MTKKVNDKSMYVYTITILLSIIFLAVGILLAYHFKNDPSVLKSKMMPVFFSELGMAGLISIILISTIERFTRERHQQEAQKLITNINYNLFKSIYSRYIPDDVFSEVEECLLRSDVIRENYEIEYSLAYIDKDSDFAHGLTDDDAENHLLCQIDASYKLRNITDKEITHSIESYIELPIDANMRSYVEFISLSENNNSLCQDDLVSYVSETSAHKVLRYQVRIPEKSSITIGTSSKTIKRLLDMEVWASRLPSDGLTLRVTTPLGIDIESTANHSKELERQVTGNGRTMKLMLNHGIFPFQSVIFWWNGKK